MNIKQIIIIAASGVASLTGLVLGKTIYEVVSKPEAVLYIDSDKTPYLEWDKLPEKMKDGERVIVRVKKIKTRN